MIGRFLTWLRRLHNRPPFRAERPQRRNLLEFVRKSPDCQRQGAFVTINVYDQLNRIRVSAVRQATDTEPEKETS